MSNTSTYQFFGLSFNSTKEDKQRVGEVSPSNSNSSSVNSSVGDFSTAYESTIVDFKPPKEFNASWYQLVAVPPEIGELTWIQVIRNRSFAECLTIFQLI